MNKAEIRKNMVLELLAHPEYKPMKAKEIQILFGIKKREELQEILDELTVTGKIVQTARNKYMLPSEKLLKTGKYVGNPAGYGFVEVEDLPTDIFIPAYRTGGAMHGDTVSVRIFPDLSGASKAAGKRMEGEIVKILKRGFTQLTGVYQSAKGFGFVVPDIAKIGTDIYIGKGFSKNAENGDKVVVQLISYGLAGEKPRGEILEILGSSASVEVDITAIVRSYGLPHDFSEAVLEEAKKCNTEISPEEIARRLDLRQELVITIDGEDAKDLDDAISIRQTGDTFWLGVHIADVSHYVTEYSELDMEAARRGTSHYLVDRVIPMLPPALSNGICSLNPNEDRLTLSCMMQIDRQGKVLSHEIRESVIRSSWRMTYTDVAALLEPERCQPEERERLLQKYEALLPTIRQMAECAAILKAAREMRGAIDFDFTEAKFVLRPDHSVAEIKAYDRNVATRLIEDFMLAANETVAEHFFWQGVPFLYRSHGEPKEDKIKELASYLKALDYPFRQRATLHPKDLQRLLAEAEGKAEENIIRRMVLRSMQQARYTDNNEGHFGLALKYYTHFTSPIRRYPDLQIHRIIKEILTGRWNAARQEHYAMRLAGVAVKASALERQADEAERDVHKLLKAFYMQEHIGESFTGIVSGANQWGMFVELPNTVEGFVAISRLKDDFYEYESSEMALTGVRYQRQFRLGDAVDVTVLSVDKSRKVIDFGLYEEIELPEKQTGFKVEEKLTSEERASRKAKPSAPHGEKRGRQAQKKGRRKK